MKNIGVIGAGPAGLMASYIGSIGGNKVVLFDKNNKIGRKLFITGKGRCNITNASDIEDFFDEIISNSNFLYSSLYSFTNYDLLKLLKKYGLSTKIERGNRVFPDTDKSNDVLKTFQDMILENKVDLRLNTEITNIYYDDGRFKVDTEGNEKLEFDKIIISTGGISYPSTGSTGDGYRFAKNFGHSVINLKPSLVPIEIEERWVLGLKGLSLKNVNLKTYKGNRLVHEEFGEMIFTHYGISGPIVLTTSNYIDLKEKNISFSLDLKPALRIDILDKRILRDFDLYKNKAIKNALKDLLPQRLISIVLNRADIDEDKPIHQISKDERENLLATIKNLSFTFRGFRPIKEAIVTSGGVNTKEIDSSTMESKIIPGLFFAGEVIDVHALTGGYNLQIAFSTGYLAGNNL